MNYMNLKQEVQKYAYSLRYCKGAVELCAQTWPNSSLKLRGTVQKTDLRSGVSGSNIT